MATTGTPDERDDQSSVNDKFKLSQFGGMPVPCQELGQMAELDDGKTRGE